jgi:Domain of unknown function (DUF5710)
MPRIDLQVPFTEKHEARKLGARWDTQLRTWYVPNSADRPRFEKWIPAPSPPNVRAPFWYLARSMRVCWRCKASTQVFAILLPAAYEALFVGDDPADDCWERAEAPTVLSYVVEVPLSAAAHLRTYARPYRIDFSNTTRSRYWMNHCEHCDSRLGDFETLQEYGTFYEPDGTLPAALQVWRIDEPFTASCGSHSQ